MEEEIINEKEKIYRLKFKRYGLIGIQKIQKHKMLHCVNDFDTIILVYCMMG